MATTPDRAAWLDRHAGRLALATLAAFAVALAAHALARPVAFAGPDGALYEAMGRAIAASPAFFGCDNFAHAFWSPGWVALIGALYRAGGPHPELVRLALVAFALATAGLVFAFARALAGPRAALFALAFFLASRLVFLYTAHYQYEIPLAFCIAAAGALWFPARPRPGARGAALDLVSGLVVAWGALLSPRILLLVPIAAALVARREGARRLLVRAPAIALGVALVLLPWGARNHACFGRWVFTTTNGGFNLWIAHHPGANGGFDLPPVGQRPAYELHDDAAWRRDAVASIAADPLRAAVAAVVKGVRFWIPLYVDQGILVAVAALGLAGHVRARRHGGPPPDPRWAWIVAVPLALTAVQMVFFAQARYFLPAQPAVAIGAGATLAAWTARRRAAPDGAAGATKAAPPAA